MYQYTPGYFATIIDNAIPVRLAARSFIMPVPANIGKPAFCPKEGLLNIINVFKGAAKIVDRQGLQKHGIVFRNYTDGATQCARDDGKSIIIVNGVTPEQGEALFKRYQKILNGRNPDQATESDIRKTLRFAHVHLGIEDFFNGETAKIPSFEVVQLHPQNGNCGVFIRRSDEERFALLGVGRGFFEGPASSPQRFEGNVAVLKNAKHTWMVNTEAFLNTYRHPDDREIKISELPAFVMVQNQSPMQIARLAM